MPDSEEVQDAMALAGNLVRLLLVPWKKIAAWTVRSGQSAFRDECVGAYCVCLWPSVAALSKLCRS